MDQKNALGAIPDTENTKTKTPPRPENLPLPALQLDVPKTIQQPPRLEREKKLFFEKGWFRNPGAYVLLDGQFGSTGKGLAEQKLAMLGAERVHSVTTNAGPNSGHTIYDFLGTKIVTKQIPSFTIQAAMMGLKIPLHLNAGALIDSKILAEELKNSWDFPLTIHPNATAILSQHYLTITSLDKIASTQKGTGPALSDKLLRKRFAVIENVHEFEFYTQSRGDYTRAGVVFVSTAQGFSLGINSGFYPYTTCRECTVQQALSDAHIPARKLQKVIATFRSFPIRVGDTPFGTSGGWYPDQRELSWGEIGQVPETTTVTGRQRRIATWSDIQFRECVAVNEPDALFLNFLNYLPTAREATKFAEHVVDKFMKYRGVQPDFVMLGFGPKATDVDVAFTREDLGHIISKRMDVQQVNAK
jgi:adenylosuccinate synthase